MTYNNSSNIEITQWINILTKLQIPFYIYKLHIHDSIIYKSENLRGKILILLEGSIYLQKIFNNNESICIAILHKNSLINSSYDHNYISQLSYYYQIVSLSTTYIISFHTYNLQTYNTNLCLLLMKLNRAYSQSLLAYENMIHIMTHKYIKYRTIQLILLLCKEKGITKNNKILIKLSINQSSIGEIVGSNKNTICKIIQNLKKQKIIKYSNYNKMIIINDIIALNKFKFTE